MEEPMKKTRIDTQKLLNSFFDPNQTSAIGSAFHCMDLAEEEIALAKSDYPVFEAQIHDAFRHLCPTEPLRGLSDDVYRHHCREILQRIVNGEGLRPGTAAECLCALAAASLELPPTRAAGLLYWELFERVLPDQADTLRKDHGDLAFDQYDRIQMKELEAELRRKLTSDRGGA
jgi:hypothetical protein